MSYLAADEICLIIETARKNGVQRLLVGDLQIAFTPDELTLPPAQANLAEMDTRAKESLKKELQHAQDDELSELLITNPVEFERRLREDRVEHGSYIEDSD